MHFQNKQQKILDNIKLYQKYKNEIKKDFLTLVEQDKLFSYLLSEVKAKVIFAEDEIVFYRKYLKNDTAIFYKMLALLRKYGIDENYVKFIVKFRNRRRLCLK